MTNEIDDTRTASTVGTSNIIARLKARHEASQLAQTNASPSPATHPSVFHDLIGEHATGAMEPANPSHFLAMGQSYMGDATGTEVTGGEIITCGLEHVGEPNPLYNLPATAGGEDCIKGSRHLRAATTSCNGAICTSRGVGSKEASAEVPAASATETAPSHATSPANPVALVLLCEEEQQASKQQAEAVEGGLAVTETDDSAPAAQPNIEEAKALAPDDTVARQQEIGASAADNQSDVGDESLLGAVPKIRPIPAAPDADSITHVYLQLFENGRLKGKSPWTAKMLISTSPVEEIDTGPKTEVFANLRKPSSLRASVRRATTNLTVTEQFCAVVAQLSHAIPETNYVSLLTRTRREAFNSESQIASLDLSDPEAPTLMLMLGNRDITIKCRKTGNWHEKAATFFGYYDPLGHHAYQLEAKKPKVTPIRSSGGAGECNCRAEVEQLTADVGLLKRAAFIQEERNDKVRERFAKLSEEILALRSSWMK